jgi:hypothetical protein
MKYLILSIVYIGLFCLHASETGAKKELNDTKENKNNLSLVTKLLASEYELDIESVKQIDCLSGITVFGAALIEYEVFPNIGIFRVKIEGLHHADNKWIIIEDKSVSNIGKGAKELPQEVRQKILLVGSGLLKMDLTRTRVTCWKNTDYFLVFVRKKPNGQENPKFPIVFNNQSDENEWMWKKGEFWQLASIGDSPD